MKKSLRHTKFRWIVLLGLVMLVMWLLRPIDIAEDKIAYSAVINDDEGRLLSAQIARDGQWRFPMIDTVPMRFERAILAFEDRRFYNHPGIDPLAICRALVQNIREKRIVSGASTITMQLARMLSNHAQRSVQHKLSEMLLAVRIELWYSKGEILRKYASVAPFGGNVVGLEAACWRYFQKSPQQLSWAEAATLAVLPNAPSLIHVNKNRDLLLEKRNSLLNTLLIAGEITDIDFELSQLEILPSKTYALPQEAPHLLQYSKSDDMRHSISRSLQRSIGEVLDLLHIEWSQNDIQNAGAIVLDTRTGDVLAYHGNVPSTTFEKDVDVAQARRSSGSILKPFLFGAMLDNGLMTPTSLLVDIPTYIDGFHPTNYHREHLGLVPADEALQRSLNVPAVRSLQEYGVPRFLNDLRDIGFSTFSKSAGHYGLSLILGGGEVTLWELAQTYRVMGASLLDHVDVDFPISKSAVYKTLEALKGVHRPDEEGNWQRFGGSTPIAWKTGTSYGHRDAWAVGVSPEVTIAAWVGNADGEGRDGIIGTSTAGRLLFSILGRMDIRGEWFRAPHDEMTWLQACASTGYLAGPSCQQVDTVYWPQITERAASCPYHKEYLVSQDHGLRVSEDCADRYDTEVSIYLDLPPSTISYYERGHPEYRRIPDFEPGCHSMTSDQVMTILYPLSNDQIYLPKDFNAEEQELIAKLSHKDYEATIFWYLDDQYVGKTEDQNHHVALQPIRGQYLLTAVDQRGNVVKRQFSIN